MDDEPGVARVAAGVACGVAFPMIAALGAVLLQGEGEGELDLLRGSLFGVIALLGFLFAAASLRRLPVVSSGFGRWGNWVLLAASSVYLVSFSFILWPALLAGLSAPGMLGRPRSRSRP